MGVGGGAWSGSWRGGALGAGPREQPESGGASASAVDQVEGDPGGHLREAGGDAVADVGPQVADREVVVISVGSMWLYRRLTSR